MAARKKAKKATAKKAPTKAKAATATEPTAREKADLRDQDAEGGFELEQDRAVSKEEKERRLKALSPEQRARREKGHKPEKLTPQIEVDRRTMAAYQPVVRPGSTEPIIPPTEDEEDVKSVKPREAGLTDRKLALAQEVEPDPVGAGRAPTS